MVAISLSLARSAEEAKAMPVANGEKLVLPGFGENQSFTFESIKQIVFQARV